MVGAYIERGESVVYEDVISQICNAYSVNRDFFEGIIDLPNACTKMNDIHPGQRLKTAREEKGWTQAELAARSNVLAPVISRVEAGAKLTERQGVKLAEALEVGFDWLMNGREDRKKWPADQSMIDWLWKNESIREELWNRMKCDKRNPSAKASQKE